MSRILVGIDGSASSRRALQWAVDAARLRDVDVHVLHAFKNEYVFYADIPATAMAIPRPEVEALAAALVEEAISSIDNPNGVKITTEIINSANPAGALIDRSTPDDLIVLGTRGLGGLTGMLLGSVSLKVMHHSTCPVTIVPGADGEDGA